MKSLKMVRCECVCVLIASMLMMVQLSGCEKVPTFQELVGDEDPAPDPVETKPTIAKVDEPEPPMPPKEVEPSPPQSTMTAVDLFQMSLSRDRNNDHVKAMAELDLNVREEILKLDLNGSQLTDVGAEYLPEFPMLETLLIGGTGVTDSGLQYVGKLTRLRVLSLQGMGIDGDGLPFIAGLTEMRHLNLGATSVTDPSFEHLLSMDSLEVLNVSGISRLNGQGIAELARRGALMNLRELYASHTSVGHHGLEGIKKMPSLQILNLNSAEVSDRQLAGIQGCQELVELYLESNLIGNNGLKGISKLQNLEHLVLKDCPGVTDQALNYIKNLKNLKKMNLNGTRCTSKSVLLLKQKFLKDTLIGFDGTVY